MAEISQSVHKPKQGVQKVKHLSTRVDLTPMVDLGFLLITFFIFTTTMAKSKAMNLVMPSDEKVSNPPKHPAEQTLTLLPGPNNTLYFYDGLFRQAVELTDYKTGIRKLITDRKQWLYKISHNGNKLLVLIKPSENSSYKNMVDILDEMLINDVSRYMIVDISREEEQLMLHK